MYHTCLQQQQHTSPHLRENKISAMDNDKVEATFTALSLSQEIFYKTTPTRRVIGYVDKQEVANYTARLFGTTASPYLVKYIYDDGEYLDTQY
jgi:hypothetical protein